MSRCLSRIFLMTITLCFACKGIGPSKPIYKSPEQVENRTKIDTDQPHNNQPIQQPIPNEEPAVQLTEAQKQRARECIPSDSALSLPILPPTGSAPNEATKTPVEDPVKFAEIRSSINQSCQSCHLAPMEQGGFTYMDRYHGDTIVLDGRERTLPGFFEAAEKMAKTLQNGTMPPTEIHQTNPEKYDRLGDQLQQWIDQGKQEKVTTQPQDSGPKLPAYWGNMRADLNSDLGDCVPNPEIIGDDAEQDSNFAQMQEAPERLSMTDLFTQDPHLLAKRGTVAYNIEYPLWSDNDGKQRWIHLPSTGKGADNRPLFSQPMWEADKIGLPGTGFFNFPENTRFYKTFYKRVKTLKGDIRFFPVETRLVVVRKQPQTPLYATYVWRKDMTDADLLTAPYRDGTPWKDYSLEVDHDQQQQLTRPHFFPAKHRCEHCHMGAKDSSGILGFLPVQINRLAMGEGANDKPFVGQVEQNEIKRLISYGMLESDLPSKLKKLVDLPSQRPLQDVTVRAQGYFLGNCTHCHSQPNGFAYKIANIKMDLSEGKIFDFNTKITSSQFDNLKLVHHEGDLNQSYLFFRFGAKSDELKSVPRMPMHTAAAPDCYGLKTIARWIKSYDPNMTPDDVNKFVPDVPCNSPDEFKNEKITWVDEDFTEPKVYAPRRADWQDQEKGMPEQYRNLRFDPSLAKLAQKEFPLDFWMTRGKQCHLPEKKLTQADLAPWLVKYDDHGKPLKDANGDYVPTRGTLAEIYWTTPGAYFFNRTCTKCHGRDGAGDGPIAKSLYQASEGNIRVASFTKGMFGNNGSNAGRFAGMDQRGTPYNFAGNYFIWMAMEGTNMTVPEGMNLSDLLGPHKAKMLNSIRDACIREVETHPKHPNPQFDRERSLLEQVCLTNNNPRSGWLGEKSGFKHPDLQFKPGSEEPLNRAFLDKWADQAAINAGWMIYDYVKGRLAVGNRQVSPNECEAVSH